MSSYLLDTSALVAWLQGEAGAERVRSLLRGDDPVFLPWPALIEVYYLTSRASGEAMARQRYAALRALPVHLVESNDESFWLSAARFKASFGLSFADALIAALARQSTAILVHKDPELEPLASEIALESLDYKPRHRARP